MEVGRRALRRGAGGVALVDGVPAVAGPGEVVVEVAYAGVCRTDLAVADGLIAVAPGRVLGHELSGWVDGAPVTVIPFAPCGACACIRGGRCEAPRWLGVDRDGAFADQVVVPAPSVLPLPVGLSLVLGAYVEPVAAALGVLPWITPGARVLVAGDGRIAALTARVIGAHGGEVVRAGGRGALAPRSFDVVIEHGGLTPALVAAARSGGVVLVRSRGARAVELDAGELVARELSVHGVGHGSFTEAIDWLRSRRIIVDDLLAEPRSLEAYAEVLGAARDEQRKQMFVLAGAARR